MNEKSLKTAIELGDFFSSNGRKVNREFTTDEFTVLLTALADYAETIETLIEQEERLNDFIDSYKGIG